METALLCLANSKKYGERCIAGIEVRADTELVHFLYIGEKPKWIRPVSFSEHGEVSNAFVAHVDLLDVIALNIINPCPLKAQTENVFFKQERLQVLCKIEPTPECLDALCSKASPLFGNTLPYVSEREINNLDHSLVLISVENFSYIEQLNVKGAPQLRATFTHQKYSYDLPITDLNFIQVANTLVPRNHETPAYLTISLGEVFRGKYYKLIAGVIIL